MDSLNSVSMDVSYLQNLIPGVTGGQPEQREHGRPKRQEVGMWVLLAQLVAGGAKQVHAQNGVDEEHEEQQAAHIEHRRQRADQGVEQRPQSPVCHSYVS